MKILLVNPNFGIDAIRPPLGLAYIAAVLENAYEVRILDLALYHENLKKLSSVLDEFKPDVVGITCYTSSFSSSMNIAKCVKNFDKKIITLVGGAHATIRPADCLNDYVDFVVRGEGEITFPELLEHLMGNRNLEEIKGISYRIDGRVIHNPERPFITDLSKYPFPARHLLEMEKYSDKVITMLTSRGCPFNCIFCSRTVTGRKHTAQTPERVIEEIKEVLSNSEHTHVHFVEELFTFDKKRVERICELLISNNIRFTWSCSSRVSNVDENLLTLMKKAGCIRINFGVESGDETVLKSLKKGITLDQVRKTFKDCKAIGIETFGYFIIGFPEDTRETVYKTINLAMELNPENLLFSIATPLPGAELWDIMGMNKRPADSYSWDDFRIQNAAPLLDTKYLTKEDIFELYQLANLKWRRQLFIKNMSKPTYLLKKIVVHPRTSLKQFIGLLQK
jgi:anaerobic magnesium-protoporphyrin IX monomethyl ester cyclase